MKQKVIIIGAGPAGLTSGLLLARNGYEVCIYESDPEYVGGLSRTVKHNGFRIDIGGHRFFTKDAEVQQFWRDILKDQMLVRSRISRIFYKKKLLRYPLKPLDLLSKIRILESSAFLLSYLKSKLFPKKNISNFENWIIANFGERLYLAFFKSYTEKVWGMDCTQISSDWAVQRINNLNVTSILKTFIAESLGYKSTKIKTLINQFEYPVHGPGMLWEKVRDDFVALGGKIVPGQKVMSTSLDQENKWSVRLSDDSESIKANYLINTAPLREFLLGVQNEKLEQLKSELNEFKYRAFITIAIMFKGKNTFPDNWIYIHDGRVKVARIQNYGNWSPEMVPSSNHVCYGMEYFCQKDDELWKKTDQELFEMALQELQVLQLQFTREELDFKIVRCPNAYPVYDLNYNERLEKVKKFIDQHDNLFLIGRSGLHRYNNQDHAIKTAMLVCQNIILKQKKFDPWKINQDAEYIEEVTA